MARARSVRKVTPWRADLRMLAGTRAIPRPASTWLTMVGIRIAAWPITGVMPAQLETASTSS
ncbi:MAG: hypothetical protein JSW68_08380 [Burkholderiales bacterium]|nr:MAG: hypothetical protein JSW68_08380 [Burkholderiales bacterium]